VNHINEYIYIYILIYVLIYVWVCGHAIQLIPALRAITKTTNCWSFRAGLSCQRIDVSAGGPVEEISLQTVQETPWHPTMKLLDLTHPGTQVSRPCCPNSAMICAVPPRYRRTSLPFASFCNWENRKFRANSSSKAILLHTIDNLKGFWNSEAKAASSSAWQESKKNPAREWLQSFELDFHQIQ